MPLKRVFSLTRVMLKKIFYYKFVALKLNIDV